MWWWWGFKTTLSSSASALATGQYCGCWNRIGRRARSSPVTAIAASQSDSRAVRAALFSFARPNTTNLLFKCNPLTVHAPHPAPPRSRWLAVGAVRGPWRGLCGRRASSTSYPRVRWAGSVRRRPRGRPRLQPCTVDAWRAGAGLEWLGRCWSLAPPATTDSVPERPASVEGAERGRRCLRATKTTFTQLQTACHELRGLWWEGRTLSRGAIVVSTSSRMQQQALV